MPTSLIDSLQQAGPWMVPACLALFVLANVCFVPATLLCLAAGFVCGFPLALATVAIARPTAALIAYGLAHGVLRARVRRLSQRFPRFQALDRAIGSGGLRLVVLLRLSPLFPSTLSNYVLGATAVRLSDYAIGSAVGTLPSSTLYTYLGSGLAASTAIWTGAEQDADAGRALFWVGLAATGLLVWLLARGARRELERLVP